MSRIIILDPLTASQIAAGEVVERPSSVVKELVENSLDAGASLISVEIEGGGISRIAVTDNGCGMTEEEARLAFCRHATSKIRDFSDLNRITTLGFRGEALPSIAAVSQLTLKTRPAELNQGFCIEMHGGQEVYAGPVGCPVGTTIVVKDLFYNTPARRKFLKTKATESGLVSDVLYRLAFTRPDVTFSLVHNGREIFRSPGTGELRHVVAAVYGIEVADKMIPVNAKNEFIEMKALVGSPLLHRSTRNQQTIIINGRYVRHPALTNALEEAYRPLIGSGRHPVAVLSIDLDPGLIDVNVHPAKLEIKLEREEEIADFIVKSVRAALNTGKTMMVSRFSKPAVANSSSYRQESLLNSSEFRNVADASDISENLALNEERDCSYLPRERIEQRRNEKFPHLWPIGQLLSSYVIAGGEDGLYIIDQHAAHERILYEQFLKQIESGSVKSQMLMIPVTLHVGFKEVQLLRENLHFFHRQGFIVEEFGEDTLLLRGVPLPFKSQEGEELLVQMLDLLSEPGRRLEDRQMGRRLAAAMACRAAIKAGEKLSIADMESLIARLALTEEPFTCPHGRPTVIRFSNRDLNKFFRRE